MSSPTKAPRGTVKWDRSVMQRNVSSRQVYRNIRSNIRRQLPQVPAPDTEQPDPIMIVGGGWSLEDTFDELLELYFKGIKICALNNAANMLMERNVRPSIHMIMDARPENRYMVERPIPGCKVFLASQCHPSLFKACRGREVYIFHVVNPDVDKVETRILKEYYRGRCTYVPGAGSVGIASVPLMRIVGFRFQHLFGIDSCYAQDEKTHHWYPQPLNDGEPRAPFWCAGKRFICSPWQASQAEVFQNMAKAYGDTLELTVHGEGAIAHVIRTGAKLVEKKDGRDAKSAVTRKAGGKGKGRAEGGPRKRDTGPKKPRRTVRAKTRAEKRSPPKRKTPADLGKGATRRRGRHP